MHSLDCILAILATASQVAAVPRVSQVRASPVQRYLGPPTSYVYNQTRADAVKQTFQISWDGYYQYAFPGDSLLPVSNSFENDRLVQPPQAESSSSRPLTGKQQWMGCKRH
jgi:mannosyl-oligosaccharide alpha-1,2-mannosidase